MFNKEFSERQNDINNSYVEYNDINVNIDKNDFSQQTTPTMFQQPSTPIIEPMQERVVQRTIMHDVDHVCPIRTRIINNHVFRHTYRPAYSCCEENTCTNVQCNPCSGF